MYAGIKKYSTRITDMKQKQRHILSLKVEHKHKIIKGDLVSFHRHAPLMFRLLNYMQTQSKSKVVNK